MARSSIVNRINSNLTKLSAVTHYALFDGRAQKRIRRVIYDVTYRCNLRCSFCIYYNKNLSAETVNRLKVEELSIEEIKNTLIPQLKDAKAEHITITGGEPLIRNDITEILKAFSNAGFKVTLLSNLSLCNEEKAKAIVQYVDRLVVSLEGPEKMHDNLAGAKGAFEKTTNGIKMVLNEDKKGKLDLSIKFVITAFNAMHLVDMIKTAKQLGVKEVGFSLLEWQTEDTINPVKENAEQYQVVSAALVPEHRKIEPTLLYRQYKLAKDQARQDKIRMTMTPIPKPTKKDLQRWYYDQNHCFVNKCLVPYIQLRITPNGDIMPCLEVNMGNIKKEHILTIWNNQKYKQFRKAMRRKLPQRCMKCCKLCEPAYKYLFTIRK